MKDIEHRLARIPEESAKALKPSITSNVNNFAIDFFHLSFHTIKNNNCFHFFSDNVFARKRQYD
jgi:hypothetical protein